MNFGSQNGAAVCNGAHWEMTTDLDRLHRVQAKPLGNRHHPLNHGDALEMFRETLDSNGLNPVKSYGMLSKDGLKYIYVADIIQDEGEVLTNGFINYNDRSKSFTVIMGERVFVCSNECVSHQLSDLRRRHTGNVFNEVRERIQKGIDRFLPFAEKRREDIRLLKSTGFGENELGKVVLKFHRDGGLSNSNIDRIIGEYDNPRHDEFQDRTAWNFHNACTEVFKRIDNPITRMGVQSRMNEYIHEVVGINPVGSDWKNDNIF